MVFSLKPETVPLSPRGFRRCVKMFICDFDSGKQADSGKGPALFIEDEAKFQRQMSQAKAVLIRLPQGSGSLKSLGFEVGGFRAERYDKP